MNKYKQLNNKALARACTQIVGLYEAIANENIGPVALYPETAMEKYHKVPMVPFGESWTTHKYTLDELNTRYQDCNIGVKLGKPSSYLAVIDIDGTYEKGDEDMKIKSRQYNFNVLKEHLVGFNDMMWIETANGGFHGFYYSDHGSAFINKHELSNKFAYPDSCEVEELSGKHFKGAIEIFDGRKLDDDGEEVTNRQVVFTGSRYGDREYRVISEQNDISKLPVIDNIEERLQSALLSAGFKPLTDLNKRDSVPFESPSMSDSVPIPDENIPMLAEFLGDLYKFFDIHNCKYYATQCLAGYLFLHTDYDSALKLGHAIIDYCGELFKSGKVFLDTLLNDFINPPTDQTKVQGGRRFYNDFCRDIISSDYFWGKLILLMGGNYQFYVGNRSAKQVNEIVLNREKGKVFLNSYVEMENDFGPYLDLSKSKEIAGFCPIGIERITNPLNPYEAKIVLHCVSKLGDITVEAENAEELLSSLKSMNGARLNHFHFSDVIHHIINKFFELDLVLESEKSFVSGVFIHNRELLRFNEDGDMVPIAEPSSDEIAKAFSLIKNVLDVLPHDNLEIGLLIRKSLLIPFGLYYKSHGRQIRYICISGTGGTGKSTLGELCLSIYQPIIRAGDFKNVVGGSSFDSSFKIGNLLSKSSYGVLVNEPDTAFEKDYLKEILKNSTTDIISREAGGKKFPAYQSPIFAANVTLPSEPEFLRRIVQFNFTPKYEITEGVKQSLAQILNVNGVQNKNFELLNVIGDYIIWFLANNLNLLDELSIEDLELRLVDELESKSRCDLSFMKMRESDEDYLNLFADESQYDNVMDIFRRSLRDMYTRNKIYVSNSNLKDVSKTFDENILIQLIKMGVYDYLTLIKADESYIVIKDKESNDLFKFNGKHGISGRKFYEEYLREYESEYGEFDNNNHATLDGGKRGTKVPKSFILDFMNGEI